MLNDISYQKQELDDGVRFVLRGAASALPRKFSRCFGHALANHTDDERALLVTLPSSPNKVRISYVTKSMGTLFVVLSLGDHSQLMSERTFCPGEGGLEILKKSKCPTDINCE